ncbi:SNF2 family N-terminal domain-containing protein [Cryptosporidium andersoni]|uniref:SNF2 family N-terminal domain-containing protein n=1 Tax=Cryptosporidium andersoni TaxID=117008 RepID=A0A1J4MHB7_9CRYT|nr:SNF2 family N-terminal domain-containing protein [Cryptosporidium andersoni]
MLNSDLENTIKPKAIVLLKDAFWDPIIKEWISSYSFGELPSEQLERILAKLFIIMVSPSNISRCVVCGKNIVKGTYRIGAPEYDRRGRYGIINRWYHKDKCSQRILKSAIIGLNLNNDSMEDVLNEKFDEIIYGWMDLPEEIKKSIITLSTSEDIDEKHEIIDSDDLVRREIVEIRESPVNMIFELLKFQKEGLAWMCKQEMPNSLANGGILADEMGMGKTIQMIALMLEHTWPPVANKSNLDIKLKDKIYGGVTKKNQEYNCEITGQNLVIAPVAAVLQWRQEIERFSKPGVLKVHIYHGNKRSSTSSAYGNINLDEANVVITTYPTLEAEYRRISSLFKIKCPYCNRNYLKQTLKLHLKYFCGPNSIRTEKQALTQRKNEGLEKSMRTLKIGIDPNIDKAKQMETIASNLPTISNVYREILAKANLLDEVSSGIPWFQKRSKIKVSTKDIKSELGKYDLKETNKELVNNLVKVNDVSDEIDNPSEIITESSNIKKIFKKRVRKSRNFDTNDNKFKTTKKNKKCEDMIDDGLEVIKSQQFEDSIIKEFLTWGNIKLPLKLNTAKNIQNFLNNIKGKTLELSKKYGIEESILQSLVKLLELSTRTKKADLISFVEDILNKILDSNNNNNNNNNKSNIIKRRSPRLAKLTEKNKTFIEYKELDSDNTFDDSGSDFNELSSYYTNSDDTILDKKSSDNHNSYKSRKIKNRNSSKIKLRNVSSNDYSSSCDENIDIQEILNGDDSDNNNNDDDEVSILASLRHNSPIFRKVWGRIILDEAHRIKARTTSTAKAIFALQSFGTKWCLTGTPLQNRVGELYSLVRFIGYSPYAYYFCQKRNCNCRELNYVMHMKFCPNCNHARSSHYSYFNKMIINPIKRYGFSGEGRKALKRLKDEILDVVLLRRTKVQRQEDIKLPPLNVRIRYDNLSLPEKDFYTSLYQCSKIQFDTYVQEGTILHNYAHVFDLISRLRQAADHPYLIVYGQLRPPVTEEINNEDNIKEDSNLDISKNKKSINLIPSKSRAATDEDLCYICMDNVLNSDRVIGKCYHSFHRDCLIDYMNQAPQVEIPKELEDGTETMGVLGCPCCYAPLTVDLRIHNNKKTFELGQYYDNNDSLKDDEQEEEIERQLERRQLAKEMGILKDENNMGLNEIEKQKFDDNLLKNDSYIFEHVRNKNIIRQIKSEGFESSTKINALLDEINQMILSDPDAKGIIFSQFTNMLDLVMYKLKKSNIDCALLAGSMTMIQRNSILYSFNKFPDLKLLLISLKAGGEGLNLQVANYVFLLDPWWNPAVELQAFQRAHRIGQTKPVTAIRFIIKDTIEERMVQLQEKKQLVFDGTVGASNQALQKLNTEDLKFLFQN